MCGIAGLVAPDLPVEGAQRLAAEMAVTLEHRGPDSAGADGVTIDRGRGGAAFAVRRLAVVAPGPDGAQPLWSPSRRYLVACNGEIYDAAEAAAELAAGGHRPASRSDTAVLAAALDRWGVDETLARTDGMFGLAVWDTREQRLHLARDRFGEKPLYWARVGGRLLFGSELRAVVRGMGVPVELDPTAALLLVRQGYVPAPLSIAAGVQKLEAGAWVSWSPGGPVRHGRHFNLLALAEGAAADPIVDPDAVDERVEAALRQSVQRRLRADVPLGLLLSGGVDSSLLLALATDEAHGPITTFTIGFDESELDERGAAREVAAALGAQHHELEVPGATAVGVVAELPELYDEPLGDPSQVPTVLLARLARQHVTVALGGDGGDELFGGYHHHVQPVPAPEVGRGRRRRRRAGAQRVEQELRRLARWPDAHQVVPGVEDKATAFARWPHGPGLGDHLSDLMFMDTVTFLADDVLVKADRAAMSVGLENRCPYLSADLARVAWQIPAAQRLGPDGGKATLRRLLTRSLPAELARRPKQGFNPPLDRWLRGPLRTWAHDALADEVEGLDLTEPRRLLESHLEGEADAGWRLWPVLVLADWWHRTPLRSVPPS
jgi:asparagine synthase (glutamine-hydrolysing)